MHERLSVLHKVDFFDSSKYKILEIIFARYHFRELKEIVAEMDARTDARNALETLFTFLSYQSFRFLLQYIITIVG